MSDPVFLITGASSGIGAATARAAAAAGYRLVLAARSTQPLEALAGELGGSERALAVPCDVTEWEQQQAMVQTALERFGRLDVAFANAGFGAARGFLADTPEHWRSMVLTNVYGAALTIRATIPAARGVPRPPAARPVRSRADGRCRGRSIRPPSVAVTAMGEAARLGAERHRRAGDADRAGDGGHAVLREPGRRQRSQAGDVARTVMFAVSQPPHVDINEILVRPTAQSS